MRRIGLAVALTVSLMLMPLAARPQQRASVPVIGLLFAGDPVRSPQLRGFYRGLEELGYIEGKTIHVEVRAAEGRQEKLPTLVAELVDLKPSLIVTSSTPAAAAAKAATRTIPIVALVVGDPIGAGLVTNLGRPEANVTGMSLISPELGIKRLDLLKQALPQVSRVAIVKNSLNSQHLRDLRDLEGPAKTMGVRLIAIEASKPEEISQALAGALKERVGAVIVLADSMYFSFRQTMIDFAAVNRLPIIYPYREMPQEGGFISYGLNLSEHYRRGASYVDRILKGARPTDIPFEQPTTFELVINLKTAKALGLTIPQSVLVRADQIIE